MRSIGVVSVILIVAVWGCGGRVEDGAAPSSTDASVVPTLAFDAAAHADADPCPYGQTPLAEPADCDWPRFGTLYRSPHQCPPKIGMACNYLWLRLAPGDDPNLVPPGFVIHLTSDGAVAIWESPPHNITRFDERSIAAGCEALRRYPRATLECETPR